MKASTLKETNGWGGCGWGVDKEVSPCISFLFHLCSRGTIRFKFINELIACLSSCAVYSSLKDSQYSSVLWSAGSPLACREVKASLLWPEDIKVLCHYSLVVEMHIPTSQQQTLMHCRNFKTRHFRLLCIAKNTSVRPGIVGSMALDFAGADVKLTQRHSSTKDTHV